MLLWTECNLKCSVCLKPTRPLDGVPGRKEKMIVLSEIVYRTSVEFGIRRPSFLARGRRLVARSRGMYLSVGGTPFPRRIDTSPPTRCLRSRTACYHVAAPQMSQER